jgi:hypothetical protein
MRRLAFVLVAVLLASIAAGAQTAHNKISGKQTCAKPDPNYSIDVGDMPGHSFMMQKSTCHWDKALKIAGENSTDSTDVASVEANGPSMTEHGFNMTTMDGGDKFTVRYMGTIKGAKDGTAAFSGKWTFASGTGKLKGIKGGGTYKGSGATDGSGIVDVEGEYTLPAANAPAKPAM